MPSRTVIAAYVRSPFTPARKGELASIRPDDLAAQVIAALVKQTAINPTDIEDLILGCAFPEGEQGFNVARMISLIAGLPLSLGAATINRYCGSSMTAVHIAAGAIAMGAGEAFIYAGVESMSRVPMMGFNPLPNPALAKFMPAAYLPVGDTAENVATRWKISRREQEQFAVESHRRAAAARTAGKFKDEIVAITTNRGNVTQDSCIRPETTLEALAALKPAFSATGSVTAGTSSPLTDGAVALLVCSENYAKRNKLNMLASIKSVAVAGCAPEIVGVGPVGASKKSARSCCHPCI